MTETKTGFREERYQRKKALKSSFCKPGTWESYEAAEDHQEKFDIKITAIIKCNEADCNEQKGYFGITGREESSFSPTSSSMLMATLSAVGTTLSSNHAPKARGAYRPIH
jgi:hypothetical protein